MNNKRPKTKNKHSSKPRVVVRKPKAKSKSKSGVTVITMTIEHEGKTFTNRYSLPISTVEPGRPVSEVIRDLEICRLNAAINLVEGEVQRQVVAHHEISHPIRPYKWCYR